MWRHNVSRDASNVSELAGAAEGKVASAEICNFITGQNAVPAVISPEGFVTQGVSMTAILVLEGVSDKIRRIYKGNKTVRLIAGGRFSRCRMAVRRGNVLAYGFIGVVRHDAASCDGLAYVRYLVNLEAVTAITINGDVP